MVCSETQRLLEMIEWPQQKHTEAENLELHFSISLNRVMIS